MRRSNQKCCCLLSAHALRQQVHRLSFVDTISFTLKSSFSSLFRLRSRSFLGGFGPIPHRWSIKGDFGDRGEVPEADESSGISKALLMATKGLGSSVRSKRMSPSKRT